MKFVFVLALAVMSVYCEETYNKENDNFDIESLVADPSGLRAFVDCFNDKGECSEVMSAFKKDLGEAVQQSCAKCTSAQKHILKRFLEELKQKMPAQYQELKDKYDSQAIYMDHLEAAIANA